MADPKRAQLIDDLLLLVACTELGERVPTHGLELWALDCARRALGVDLRVLDAHVGTLRVGLSAARALLRERDSAPLRERDLAPLRADFEHAAADVDAARTNLESLERGRGLDRALRAVEATRAAMDCAEGRGEAGPSAQLARGAFLEDDQAAEVEAQLRRLLLRCGLLPSGVELLVRLDYAEAKGALPRDPEQLAWIDAQRSKLMSDDAERRLIVVLRYLEPVFLAELERVR